MFFFFFYIGYLLQVSMEVISASVLARQRQKRGGGVWYVVDLLHPLPIGCVCSCVKCLWSPKHTLMIQLCFREMLHGTEQDI
jgi:hypothetical protein